MLIRIYQIKRTPTHLYMVICFIVIVIHNAVTMLYMLFSELRIWQDLASVVIAVSFLMISLSGLIAERMRYQSIQIKKMTTELKLTQNEKAETQSELYKMRNQFIQAQKMDAIGKFAGGIAHDFNNIMTVILGYANLLSEDSNLKKTSIGDDVLELKNAAERATKLCRQLLAFSRRQVIEPKTFPINNIIQSMKEMIRRLLQENIEIILNLDPQTNYIRADPTQIEQAILNLASNSHDAMPKGGKFIIETGRKRYMEEIEQQTTTIHPGEYAFYSVTDTGIGMNPETMEHLFEPFFTTKEVGKGTGLGLSTVYGIVKQSNGFLSVYSELGKGTTFTLYFPLVQTPALQSTNLIQDNDQKHLEKKLQILLVEDDEALRKFCKLLLSAEGHHIVETSNGTEALKINSNEILKFDLLITDIVMPGISGFTLQDEIYIRNPTIKVLVISGYSDKTLESTNVKHHNFHFLQKPFDETQLLSKIYEIFYGIK